MSIRQERVNKLGSICTKCRIVVNFDILTALSPERR